MVTDRLLRWIGQTVIIMSLLVGAGLSLAAAQVIPGAICVSAFADVNANGMRDEGETPLAGVNVNLSTDGVIIATHLTAADDTPYCFENLSPADYTVTFTGSPTYRITTASQGSYALASGQRLTIDQFGAQPIPPEQWPETFDQLNTSTAESTDSFDTSERLVLATVGAMVVMLFMVAIGAVLFGILGRRRRRPAPPTKTYSPIPRSAKD